MGIEFQTQYPFLKFKTQSIFYYVNHIRYPWGLVGVVQEVKAYSEIKVIRY